MEKLFDLATEPNRKPKIANTKMLEITLTYPTPEGSREILIEGDRFSIGRGSDTDWRFADNGLSRLNSTIYRDGDYIWIVDENSTNGTFVNGAPVGSAGTVLNNGDTVKIGDETILRVKIQPKESPIAEVAPIPNPVANVFEANTATIPGAKAANYLPLAITAAAIFVISVSVFFIALKVFGGSEPETVAVSKDSETASKNYEVEEDEELDDNKNAKREQKESSPNPATTPISNNPSTPTSDAALTNVIQRENSTAQTNLPSGKKYLEMSPAEKNQYIQVKAEKVASLIGNRAGNPITPLAIERIKGFLDGYAKRVSVKAQSGCKFGDNLQATYERASKNAPFIIRSFNDYGIDPQIGLYLAMIESEHCICLQSPTGPLGMFQFTYLTAKAHYKAADSIIKGASPASPDDRCRPEPSANAAASYMKFLTGRYGTGPASVPLAIGSYNSGEGGLSRNLQTALESNDALPRDFWTLIANGDKLSKQFQSENFKYVPKFFAAAIIGENPKDFGLNLEPLSTYTK